MNVPSEWTVKTLQARVVELMREGMLFGSAVIAAKRELLMPTPIWKSDTVADLERQRDRGPRR